MTSDATTTPVVFPAAPGDGEETAGLGPWAIAVKRLRRNRAALGFLALFILLVLSTILAPVWANVAGTGPSQNHLSDVISVGGKDTNVVSFDGIPIGPTWGTKFFLGADSNGRDVAVRLLYGGRNSLIIGLAAALITIVFSVMIGLIAGWFRGWVDAIISPALDVLWAFPPLLLGIALGVSLTLGGIDLGIIKLEGGSKVIPAAIIGVVAIPYLARPIRGQVLALREKEFVESARSQGAGSMRIMFSELLPNLSSTLVVFLPLLIAQAILTESALSFLGAGVQAPEASWGTMLSDGIKLIISAPHLTIVPGLMLVLTVLALNIFGDGVRDALDPRAKLRLEES